MITKFKIYESITESNKSYIIRLIKSFVIFGDDYHYNIFNDLDIQDAIIYDDMTNTEVETLYHDNLSYSIYSGSDSNSYYGEYEKLKENDLDIILTHFKRQYQDDYYNFNSFEKTIDVNLFDNISYYYRNYVEFLDYLDIKNSNYPESYDKYLKLKKANDFNL